MTRVRVTVGLLSWYQEMRNLAAAQSQTLSTSRRAQVAGEEKKETALGS